MKDDLKSEILGVLNNVIVSGQRGWYLSDCPYCKKSQHMGVIFGEKVTSFVCFKCGEKGTIYRLLKHIGKLSIIKDRQTISFDKNLENKLLIQVDEIEIDLNMDKKDLPLGFRRIKENDYLENRGFTEQQFSLFRVGMTKIEPKYSNYVIFSIDNEKGDCIGYLSRTTLSKDKIERLEKTSGKKYLRYKNSLNTDFSKWLFGLNEVTDKTETVILVEGVFDKFNVDKLLKLYDDDEIKCCACFGKKISLAQIYRLQEKNIKNVIIIYDNDAVPESKRYAFELSKYFNVQVGFCKAKDPGDVNFDELIEIINSTEDPIVFNFGKVAKKKLI